MFINMAQALYNGYYNAIQALGAWILGTPAATAAAIAAGVPVPAFPPAGTNAAGMAAYAAQVLASRNAVALAAAGPPGPATPPAPPAVPPPVVLPIDAMNQVLTAYTAEQLAYYADRTWEQPRVQNRNVLPGGNALQQQQQSIDIHALVPATAPVPPAVGYWRHIVYAYLLECTNLEQVFQKVVYEWVSGERLPFPSQQTQMWLRTTEQLFFTSPQPPSIRSLTSDIRPNRAAIRGNAYARLLGWPLPGSTGVDRGSPFLMPTVSNREFMRAWEQLMYEVWRAYSNRNNWIGPNATDEPSMLELVRELREMLTARRNAGLLSREEFDAVTFFSWFHLTVYDDTHVVMDLAAQSTSPALRLKKIADRVGVPIHNAADSFFQMADAMADVLEAIETGQLEQNFPMNLQLLYMPGFQIAESMMLTVSLWRSTTGHAVKGTDVRPAVAPPAPQRVPALAAAPVSSIVPNTSRFQTVMR